MQGLGPWITLNACDKWYLKKCDGVGGSAILEYNTHIYKTVRKVKEVNKNGRKCSDNMEYHSILLRFVKCKRTDD